MGHNTVGGSRAGAGSLESTEFSADAPQSHLGLWNSCGARIPTEDPTPTVLQLWMFLSKTVKKEMHGFHVVSQSCTSQSVLEDAFWVPLIPTLEHVPYSGAPTLA